MEEAGLEAAKVVARSLLAPMPSVEVGGSGTELARAAASISEKLEDLAKELGAKARPAENRGVSRRLGKEGLVGHGGLALDPDQAEGLDDGGIKSWEELRRHLGTSASTAASASHKVESGVPGQGAGAEALRELLEKGGFSVVGSGPLGGMERAGEGALKVKRACEDLAEAIGAPSSRVAGLGGLGANINCDTGEADAFYNKSNASLTFGERPQSLGHEWTHALDFTLQRFSMKTDDEIEARFALLRFEKAVMELPGGEDLIKSEIARRAEASPGLLREALAKRLSSNGMTEQEAGASSQAMLVPLREAADALGKQWAESGAMAEEFKADWCEREWMSSKQSDVAVQAIKTFMEDSAAVMPGAGEIQRANRACEIFTVLVDSAREVELLKGCDDPTRSSFANYASFLDKNDPNKKLAGYWTMAAEMVARAAEGFFMGSPGRGALVEESCSKNFEIPQGAERSALSARYAQAMEEAMPWLAKTCGFEKEFEARQAQAQAQKKAEEKACPVASLAVAEPQKESAGAAMISRACEAFGRVVAGARELVGSVSLAVAPKDISRLTESLAARRARSKAVGAQTDVARAKAGPD